MSLPQVCITSGRPLTPNPVVAVSSTPAMSKAEGDRIQQRRVQEAGIMSEYRTLRIQHLHTMAQIRDDYIKNSRRLSDKQDLLLKSHPPKTSWHATYEDMIRLQAFNDQMSEVTSDLNALKIKYEQDVEVHDHKDFETIEILLTTITHAQGTSLPPPPPPPPYLLGSLPRIHAHDPVTPVPCSPPRSAPLLEVVGPMTPESLTQANRKATLYDKLISQMLRRAAAECILRAVIHIMSRGFSTMTRDLFLKSYCAQFGCSPESTFLNFRQHPWNTILTRTTSDDELVFVGLNIYFFQSLAFKAKLPPLDIPNYCVGFTQEQMLPLVQPLNPIIVQALVESFQSQFDSIFNHHKHLLPQTLPKDVLILRDFHPYLRLWHDDVPIAGCLAMNTTTVKAGELPADLETMTPDRFMRYLLAATLPGSVGQRAMRVLLARKARMMNLAEKERETEITAATHRNQEDAARDEVIGQQTEALDNATRVEATTGHDAVSSDSFNSLSPHLPPPLMMNSEDLAPSRASVTPGPWNSQEEGNDNSVSKKTPAEEQERARLEAFDKLLDWMRTPTGE
ncbi:hypothetical protein BGZ83_002195 [Gryganskiella cystojenkinii]|nr:hypothetical protein BGZ83_002195 [Gryganskiella cystojenkinii]